MAGFLIIDGFIKDDQQMMRINRTQLLAAIERASLISGRRGLSLVQLEGGMDTLSITAREAEIGQVNEEIPISGANGVQSAAFQTYYLMDVLRALDGEDVFMEIGDGVRQGCLRPVEDANYTYVLLMPVRGGELMQQRSEKVSDVYIHHTPIELSQFEACSSCS